MQDRQAKRCFSSLQNGFVQEIIQRTERSSIMAQTVPQEKILFVSFELSNCKWKLTCSSRGTQRRRIEINARDCERLKRELALARKKFKLPEDARVVSCYEAGRDGFWLHRFLTALGVTNYVVDPASIEVDRRGRRAKTDRIDGEALLRKLIAYFDGDRKAWKVVNPPNEEQEDARRPHRELERMKKERTAHRNRILGLLMLEGVVLAPGKDFIEKLKEVRRWNGTPLGQGLQSELRRQYERLQFVEKQILEMKQWKKRRLQAVSLKEKTSSPDEKALQQILQLMQLYGVSESAWVLVMEFFAWRNFSNHRQVGSLAGLTGTPFNSGDSAREQGISKAGNRRVRALMIELSWCWVRYQPDSKITRWYNGRFGAGGKRSRRIGIVAVARQLLVALWRYAEFGEMPEGATLKQVA
jgi:transposase